MSQTRREFTRASLYALGALTLEARFDDGTHQRWATIDNYPLSGIASLGGNQDGLWVAADGGRQALQVVEKMFRRQRAFLGRIQHLPEHLVQITQLITCQHHPDIQ